MEMTKKNIFMLVNPIHMRKKHSMFQSKQKKARKPLVYIPKIATPITKAILHFSSAIFRFLISRKVSFIR